MSQTGLNLFIPMELLINSLNTLSLSEKRQISHILDEAIAKDENCQNETVNYSQEKAFDNIKEQLKDGAIQRAERDLELVEDWFNLEEETC